MNIPNMVISCEPLHQSKICSENKTVLFNWQIWCNTMTLVLLGSFTQSSAKGDYSFTLQHNCSISRLEPPSLGTGFTFAQLGTCRSDPQEHMESNLKQQIPCCFRKLLNQAALEWREGTMQEILPFWIVFSVCELTWLLSSNAKLFQYKFFNKDFLFS